MRLNPCFNGICSRRALISIQEEICNGLNPCFNGICSRRNILRSIPKTANVLILVLMEYALEDVYSSVCILNCLFVLILALMEYALEGPRLF